MRITPSIALAALLLSAALTGCAGGGQAEKTPLTPAERTALYKTAIESARDQEMNEAVPVITAETDDLADFILPMAGISGENAAAYALAGLISEEELSEDYIIPKAFDPRVGKTVAAAVAKAARETGVARL